MRTLSLLSAVALATAAAAPAAAPLEATAERGRIVVHVFKRGLFSAFAHDHHFEVTRWRASAELPEGDLSRLSVEAVLGAASLRDRQASLSDADRRKVDAQASGPDVLDAARHPEIAWRSERAALEPAGTGGRVRGAVHGSLTLRGVTRPVALDVEAEREGQGWRVHGKGRLKQSAFGIAPFSGFGGTVAVKDEIEIELSLTLGAPDGARARP